jgi:hypothetical protein
MKAAVLVDSGVGTEPSEQVERRLGTSNHRQGNGMVQGDDGVIVDAEQDFIERDDLRPVRRLGARRFVMYGGDRCLELVGGRWAPGEGRR